MHDIFLYPFSFGTSLSAIADIGYDHRMKLNINDKKQILLEINGSLMFDLAVQM
jgi:hypothetical protein